MVADAPPLRPSQACPPEWFEEQYRLTQLPGFMEAALAALRATVGFGGQREVLLDRLRLPDLEVPALVVWGASDQVCPASQAHEAVARLQDGTMEIIPDCGHLPHVECPDRFVADLSRPVPRRTVAALEGLPKGERATKLRRPSA